MNIQNIPVKDILTDDSRFSLEGFIFEFAPEQTCQINSFDTFGILYPVIVHRDNKGRLHLVDGWKRVRFAILNRESTISAAVLPETTPVTDLVTLILCNKRYEIEYSAVNKIQFIYFAVSLNTPEKWLLKSLCMPFELKPHRDLLRECERIYNLPKELKLFCHEKKFSFKQLLNLTCHPRDLLLQLMKWKPSLQLTASILEEMASNLKDYLKRENKDIRDFVREQEIEELFDSSLGPREKTERLRSIIHMKQFPVLSDRNSVIQETVDSLKLPKGISVNWDRTLENKNLDITVRVQDPGKWDETISTLKSEKVKNSIKKILDEL